MAEIRKIWTEFGNGAKNKNWQGRWNFVIVDVVKGVVGTNRPRKYWNDFKKSLKSGDKGESDWKFQLSEKIGQLKIRGDDGKRYLMDVANLETTLQIIMLLSSKTMVSGKKANVNSENIFFHRYVIREAQKPGPDKIL